MELISFLVEFLTQRRRGAEGVGEWRVRGQESGVRSQELGGARESDAIAGEESDAAFEPQRHAKRIDLFDR